MNLSDIQDEMMDKDLLTEALLEINRDSEAAAETERKAREALEARIKSMEDALSDLKTTLANMPAPVAPVAAVAGPSNLKAGKGKRMVDVTVTARDANDRIQNITVTV